MLGLAYGIKKQGNSFQKNTGVSYESLTEASLAWCCLGRYFEKDNRILYTSKNKQFRDFIKKTIRGGRVLACNTKFVSKSFHDVLNISEK